MSWWCRWCSAPTGRCCRSAAASTASRSAGPVTRRCRRSSSPPATCPSNGSTSRTTGSFWFLCLLFAFLFWPAKKKQNKTKKDSEGFTTHQLGKPVPVCVCVCSMTSRAGRTWKWLDLSHTLRRDRGIVFGVSSICDVETGRLFIFHSLLRPIRGARSTSQALHRRLAAVKKKHKCGLIGK